MSSAKRKRGDEQSVSSDMDELQALSDIEYDRAAIDVLCLVADDLRSRLYLSAVSQMFSEANLDEAMGKGWGQQQEDALRQNIIET